jgi:6-phosphofructokinase 1
VRKLAAGKRGVMVALHSADIIAVPLSKAVANLKTVPPDSQLVRTARDTGISFGAPDEARHHSPEGRGDCI